MKPTGTSGTLAHLRLKHCRDEDLDELDEEAMKHIANLRIVSFEASCQW